MTHVVWVCSPFMVATAKGSGNPKSRFLIHETAEKARGKGRVGIGYHTENISFVETIGGDD